MVQEFHRRAWDEEHSDARSGRQSDSETYHGAIIGTDFSHAVVGFPMTIVEAYSVGTPVIGPDMGNVGDLIIDGVTGWKYNTNCKCQVLLNNLEKYQNKNENIKLNFNIKEDFSPLSNYRNLKKIYDIILNGSGK